MMISCIIYVGIKKYDFIIRVVLNSTKKAPQMHVECTISGKFKYHLRLNPFQIFWVPVHKSISKLAFVAQ